MYKRDYRIKSAVAILPCLIAACAYGGCSSGGATFPPNFLWGAAISGFQAEPGCPAIPPAECEDRGSDWYAWVTSPDLISDPNTYLSGDPPSLGPGHWELYETDYDIAASELHLNAFRTSIEWSRIFPTSTVGIEGHEALAAIANQQAIAHYRQMLSAMRARGLSPLVTLNHYTLPGWMHDAEGCHFHPESCTARGWLDRGVIVTEIAKYAGFVAEEFGDLVDRWATENEPMAIVLSGYLQPSAERTNPPGLSLAFDQARTVLAAMIEAHARMFDAVKAADTVDADGDGVAAEVGLAYAVSLGHPADPSSSLDVQAAQNLTQLYDYEFLDAVVLGNMDENLDGQTEYRADLAGRMDFLGLNYYSGIWVQGSSSPFLPDLSPLTTFDPFALTVNLDYPQGIYETVFALRDRYAGVPILITENGLPGHPENDGVVPRYLVEHLSWLERAIHDGAPVKGYFYWSIIDNYEWNHGMEWYAGLYSVEYTSPDKPRSAREAARTYARITGQNRLPDDLRSAYPISE